MASGEASIDGLGQALQKLGLEPVPARDRAGVIALFEELRPAAILIAAAQPGLDPVEIVDAIRMTERGAVIPLLVMGTGDPKDAIRSPSEALEAGADYFFRLPTDVHYLAGRVAGWIGETHSTRPRPIAPPDPELSQDLDLEAFHVMAPSFDQEGVTEHGLPTLDLLREAEARRGAESVSDVRPRSPMDLVEEDDEPTKAIFDDPDDLPPPPPRTASRQVELALELVREGERHRRAGDKSEAIEAYWAAAELYVLDGRTDEAIALYKLILHLDPTRYGVAQHAAEIAIGAGRKNDAIEMYRHTARALEDASRFEEATAVLRELVHLSPSEPTLVLRLASIEARQKRRPTEAPPNEPRGAGRPSGATDGERRARAEERTRDEEVTADDDVDWDRLLAEELYSREEGSLPSLEFSNSQMIALDDVFGSVDTGNTRKIAPDELSAMIAERVTPARADEDIVPDTIEVSRTDLRRPTPPRPADTLPNAPRAPSEARTSRRPKPEAEPKVVARAPSPPREDDERRRLIEAAKKIDWEAAARSAGRSNRSDERTVGSDPRASEAREGARELREDSNDARSADATRPGAASASDDLVLDLDTHHDLADPQRDATPIRGDAAPSTARDAQRDGASTPNAERGDAASGTARDAQRDGASTPNAERGDAASSTARDAQRDGASTPTGDVAYAPERSKPNAPRGDAAATSRSAGTTPNAERGDAAATSGATASTSNAARGDATATATGRSETTPNDARGDGASTPTSDEAPSTTTADTRSTPQPARGDATPKPGAAPSMTTTGDAAPTQRPARDARSNPSLNDAATTPGDARTTTTDDARTTTADPRSTAGPDDAGTTTDEARSMTSSDDARTTSGDAGTTPRDSRTTPTPRDPRTTPTPRDPRTTPTPRDPRTTPMPRDSRTTPNPDARTMSTPGDARATSAPDDARTTPTPGDARVTSAPDDARPTPTPDDARTSPTPGDPRTTPNPGDARATPTPALDALLRRDISAVTHPSLPALGDEASAPAAAPRRPRSRPTNESEATGDLPIGDPDDARPKHRRPRPEASRVTFAPLVPNRGEVRALFDAVAVFGLAAAQRVTGVLRFGDDEGIVVFEGHPAARRGRSAEEDLEALLARAGVTLDIARVGRPVERITAARDAGEIDAIAGGALLHRHLEEGILEALRHRGTWRFIPGDDADVASTELLGDREDALGTIVDLLPRLASPLELAAAIGGPRAFVHVHEAPAGGLPPRDLRLCAWLDGRKALDAATALGGVTTERGAAIALALVAFGHATTAAGSNRRTDADATRHDDATPRAAAERFAGAESERTASREDDRRAANRSEIDRSGDRDARDGRASEAASARSEGDRDTRDARSSDAASDRSEIDRSGDRATRDAGSSDAVAANRSEGDRDTRDARSSDAVAANRSEGDRDTRDARSSEAASERSNADGYANRSAASTDHHGREARGSGDAEPERSARRADSRDANPGREARGFVDAEPERSARRSDDASRPEPHGSDHRARDPHRDEARSDAAAADAPTPHADPRAAPRNDAPPDPHHERSAHDDRPDPGAHRPEISPRTPHRAMASLEPKARVRALAELVRTSDYFTILGVDTSATKAAIDEAHHHLRSLVRAPEYEAEPQLLALAREVIRSLDEARDVLKVPELRAAYQRHLKP